MRAIAISPIIGVRGPGSSLVLELGSLLQHWGKLHLGSKQLSKRSAHHVGSRDQPLERRSVRRLATSDRSNMQVSCVSELSLGTGVHYRCMCHLRK